MTAQQNENNLSFTQSILMHFCDTHFSSKFVLLIKPSNHVNTISPSWKSKEDFWKEKFSSSIMHNFILFFSGLTSAFFSSSLLFQFLVAIQLQES